MLGVGFSAVDDVDCALWLDKRLAQLKPVGFDIVDDLVCAIWLVLSGLTKPNCLVQIIDNMAHLNNCGRVSHC